MSSPLLSVVIPVATKRDGTEKCIKSVVASLRNVRDWELLVKDSTGSTCWKDMLFSLGLASGMHKHGVVEWTPDQPREMADSWNECVRISSGRYIHIMHDDDYVRPEFYSSIWPALQFGCAAVCTGYEVEEANGLVSFENRIRRDGASLINRDFFGGNPLVPSCVVVPRATYDMVGMYENPGCIDWDFYLRVCRAGAFKVVPEFLLRQVRGSESQEGRSGRVKTCEQIIETIQKWELKTGERMPARDMYLRSFVSEAIQKGDIELFRTALLLK